VLTPWRAESFLKPDSHSANQEITRVLWNPKVHYRVHLSISWARCIESIHFHQISLRSVQILSSQIRTDLPRDQFPSCFPYTILHGFLIPSMHSICLAHLNLLDLMTMIIFGEAYKLWSSSIRSLLQPPVTYLFTIKSKYPPQYPLPKLQFVFFP